MEFFNQAIDILKILVMALGAGLAVWGVINLLEGYGSDNPAAKSQGIKQLIPDRIKDKGQFEEKLNQSIRQYHPEYWRARQSGREAAEAARSTAPAKEAAR